VPQWSLYLLVTGHWVNSLLPNETYRTYNLRQRRRNRTLLAKQYTVTESDFIVRMYMYMDYGRILSLLMILSCFIVSVAVCQTFY